jgi:hypothetical protein
MCRREIRKGERYVVKRIKRSEIPKGFAAANMTADASGHVRFDICQDCQNRMGLLGEAAVDAG